MRRRANPVPRNSFRCRRFCGGQSTREQRRSTGFNKRTPSRWESMACKPLKSRYRVKDTESGSGPGGRRFKSSLPDQSFQIHECHFWFSVYKAVVDFVDGQILRVKQRGSTDGPSAIFHQMLRLLAKAVFQMCVCVASCQPKKLRDLNNFRRAECDADCLPTIDFS